MPLRYASDLVHDVANGRAAEAERAPRPREDGGLARPREVDRVAARELQETPFFCIYLVEDAAHEVLVGAGVTGRPGGRAGRHAAVGVVLGEGALSVGPPPRGRRSRFIPPSPRRCC